MQTQARYSYLFGPVPSRRFGRSLGVDLLPLKTCTMDCLFCEVGPTTALVMERNEYVPTAVVIEELRQWSEAGGATDFVTVAGAGEPTLHTGFGEVLRFVSGLKRFRSALLTNSSLLHLPEVRRDAAHADVVKATLSAWDEESFRSLHKPHGSLTFAKLLEGLRAFAATYTGELWLEVFLVPGINAGAENARRIAALANPLKPARVHLNTVIRPPAHPGIFACSAEELEEYAGLFTPRAEVTAPFKLRSEAADFGRESVLAMLARRPCNETDIAQASGLAMEAVKTLLADLAARGLIKAEMHGGEQYFAALHK